MGRIGKLEFDATSLQFFPDGFEVCFPRDIERDEATVKAFIVRAKRIHFVKNSRLFCFLPVFTEHQESNRAVTALFDHPLKSRSFFVITITSQDDVSIRDPVMEEGRIPQEKCVSGYWLAPEALGVSGSVVEDDLRKVFR